MTRYLFLLLSLLLGFAAQAGNVDIGNQVRVRVGPLSQANGSYHTTVTISNTSGQLIPGPILLQLNQLSSGLTFRGVNGGGSNAGQPIVISAQSLPAGKMVRKMLFFNGTGSAATLISQFRLTPTVLNQGAITNLTSVAPPSGMSGTPLTVTGSGFSIASQALLDGLPMPTEFVSGQELHVVVPFTSLNGQLAALPAGQYKLQVDGGNLLTVQIGDLPANPNSAGQVVTNLAITSNTALTQVTQSYQAALPNLLDQTQNDPAAQQLLQDLGDLANQLNSQGTTELLQQLGQIDPNALAMLERSLLAPPAGKATAALQQRAALTVNAITPTDGDTWLANRKSAASQINTVNDFNTYGGAACTAATVAVALFGTPGAGALMAKFCAALLAAPVVTEVISEVMLVRDVGMISRFNLQVAGLTNPPDSIAQNSTWHEAINLNLDNYNNNATTPTAQARNITGATFQISKQPPWASVLLKLGSVISDLRGLSDINKSDVQILFEKMVDQMKEYVETYATGKTDETITIPDTTKTYTLSLASVQGAVVSQTVDGDRVSVSDSSACTLDASLTRIGLSVGSDGKITVADTGPTVPFGGKIEIGTCRFQVADDLRLPMEEADSKITFNAQRHYRFDVTVNGEGSVDYDRAALSGHTTCASGTTCNEYFNAADKLTLTLTAQGQPIHWSGTGVSCADNATTCTVHLDTTNTTPLSVSVTFGNNLPIEPEMVSLPGGTYLMGISPSDAGWWDNVTQHSVTVAAFRIGKYEVTQGQWIAVMGNNPSYFSSCGDDCPVENVSWLDVQSYIAALNAQTGKNYRLPTEAEWEYACRAGSTNPYLTYCGSNYVGEVAWYHDISSGTTHPVGGKAANAFGLYDMSGNVWEWTCSNYADPWNGSELQCNNNANDGADRSYRGGSWFDPLYYVRSAARYGLNPATRYYALGFRLAQD